MVLITKIQVKWYDTPDDSEDLITDMLVDLGKAKQEVFLSAFILTNRNIIESLLELAADGKIIKILHDRSQFSADVKTRLQKLADAGASIVVSSVPYNQERYEECHEKTLTIDSKLVYTGSLNFTLTGFSQSNVVARFQSSAWVLEFKKRFNSFEQVGKTRFRQPF